MKRLMPIVDLQAKSTSFPLAPRRSTLVMFHNRREDVNSRIHNACANGSQAYWVLPH